MGYYLNSLGHLPFDDDISFYIFVINGQFEDKHYATLERNFARIAKEIGSNAVIAMGFNENLWSTELCQKYLGKGYKEIMRFLPALLLTDSHPDALVEENMRLLIPLRDAEKEFGSLETFFRELAHFVANRDPRFLNNFKDKDSWLEEANDLVDIKPNFFGIGININALITKLSKKY